MAQNSGAGGIVSPSPRLTPPAGLEQIVATFGGIYQYIRPDGGFDVHWREDFLVVVNLPFPLRLSWDHARTVSRMTCHHKMAEIFTSVFNLRPAAQGHKLWRVLQLSRAAHGSLALDP
jgi:hypothetical protein